MQILFIALGLTIIAGLGFYAGKLLFQLKQQNERQQQARQTRIDNITQSIQTIAMAMEQQQCDFSEGAIRICNLLAAIPVIPQPDYPAMYPRIHQLYKEISHFPTHDARNALSKAERRKQDRERGQIEANHESAILKELQELRQIEPY
ncbi:DUF2489 domain-containing protein [Alteromonas sp. ASW11-36]|uniref:DUF2489 domain-containing protein n=1 Tax=Alteromonas arenosi TaxID=3055817 RepID=A0ABT7ST34_9ALTE|nr:DUF2489 domain-containing protein [Alteromonas sp. ASW11-36]MDM7859353.1 DUF2489 domain-containing protein [Alteromonas sp. ASW11-36]